MVDYQQLFQQLIPGLVKIFQEPSMRIILYGSVARGTQTEESDIDLAVILPAWTRNMYMQMTDLAVDLELQYNTVLSIHLIQADKYAQWETVMPCYRSVKEEGIVLWPAA